MIERKLSSGESIYVLDNVFTPLEVNIFEEYARASLYKRIQVSKNSRSSNEEFFGSVLSETDMANIGIFNTQGFSKNTSFFNGMHIKRSWILCTEASTKYIYHTDEGQGAITMLYYMNNYWHPEWGGETLFCNNAGEPEIAVACKPNRVVIFPSYLLHKPAGIAKDAKTRYTCTTTFVTKE